MMPGGHSKPLQYDRMASRRNVHRHDWRLTRMQWSPGPGVPALVDVSSASSSSSSLNNSPTPDSQSDSCWSQVSPKQKEKSRKQRYENNGEPMIWDDREVDGEMEENVRRVRKEDNQEGNEHPNFPHVENSGVLDYIPRTPSATPPTTPSPSREIPEADADFDESREWEAGPSVSSSKSRNNAAIPSGSTSGSSGGRTSSNACDRGAFPGPHYYSFMHEENPPPQNLLPPRREPVTIEELMDQFLNGNVAHDAARSFERMAGSPPGQSLETPYFSFFPGPRMYPVPTLLYCSYSFLSKTVTSGIPFLSHRQQQNGVPSFSHLASRNVSSSLNNRTGPNDTRPYSRRATPSSTVTSSTSHTSDGGRNLDFSPPVTFAPPPLLSPIRDADYTVPLCPVHLEPTTQRKEERQASHAPRKFLQLSPDVSPMKAKRVAPHREVDKVTGRRIGDGEENSRSQNNVPRSDQGQTRDRRSDNDRPRSASSYYDDECISHYRPCYNRKNCNCRFNFRSSSSSSRCDQNGDAEQQRSRRQEKKSAYNRRRH